MGIYSVCSAHPLVIKAAVQQAVADDSHLLIEATSNQVNQFGGYTGMRPVDFVSFVTAIADDEGLAREKLILGGDHLGPNPWQQLPSDEAMKHAERMVMAYASAGFTKIHLDCSMACQDDPSPLDEHLVAERAARLCAVAEAASGGRDICYIIGTEVPVPGGATESLAELAVTPPENAHRTMKIHQKAFSDAGLADAWDRVIAIVVQPGVEFNHDSVVDYDTGKARLLQQFLGSTRGFVFEAHSTDYQRPAAYRELVQDGFAILKVGPALTFALREALFGLAAIEHELIDREQRSSMRDILEEAMLSNPQYWNHHYHGDQRAQHILRQYSYSDRVRYYWTDPKVRKAVETLLTNIDSTHIPETLLSQYLPEQYAAMRAGTAISRAEELLLHKIRTALAPYADACRATQGAAAGALR
jgi:D-tagatose-1,6-bisphosphate aldolase subunit GatZ/KbaZ